jgi:hypothetical protein
MINGCRLKRVPKSYGIYFCILVLLFFLTSILSPAAEATVFYVDGSRLFSGDGTRWDQAFKTIHEAVNAATNWQGDEIWVRRGTYAISSPIVIDNKDIAIYGGFSGSETQQNQRNWKTNVTVVDGQNLVDNCFRILTAAATIDGFTITRGGRGALTSEGGGIFIFGCWSEFPVISNCTFLNNSVNYGGGAIANEYSSPRITNCTFWGNSASFGGAIFNVAVSSPFITNCTFSGNTAWSGGAIANSANYDEIPYPTITNSILWGDIATGAGNPKEFHGITNLNAHSHNNIDQAGFAGINGNIRQDPIFVSGSSNLHLRPGSPCIDAGRNDAFFLPSIDLDGDPRIIDGDENGTATVDMGADEFDPTQQFGVWYVDGSRPSSGDGSSWGSAYKTIGEAVNAALAGDEIWVKAGTYGISTQISVAKAIKIYGGFAGGETSWNQRNWAVNVTTVDGQNTVNPCFDVSAEATIDGLKITRCVNYGIYKSSPTSLTVENCTFYQNGGMGIYTTLGSATVNNCNFSENTLTASGSGGAINNYLSSITVTNSTFTNNHSSYPTYGTGGAISAWSGSATISNSSFTGNTAESAGGAIYIDRVPGEPASNVTLTNCSFSGNSGYSGGALYNAGSTTTISNSTFNANSSNAIRNLSTLTISLSTFTGNTGYYGAGIHNTSSLTVTNSNFTDNATGVSGEGGGIYSEGGSLTISGCDFLRNKAGTSNGMGGGVHVYGSSPLSIVDSKFVGNTAYRSGGGLYYADDSFLPEIKIANSIFAGNSVDLAGGGGICFSSFSPAAITNCTFFGNKVNDPSGSGGGIFKYGNPLTLANSILWGNTASSGPQIQEYLGLTVNYCDIDQDGLAGINGNIREDPLFVDTSGIDPVLWDLRLQSISPCIDAGLNSAVPPELTMDVDSNPRIADGDNNGTATVDMGAYEYVPPPQPNISVSPASKDFGNVNLDSNAPQVFTLSNTGTAGLAVTLVELTGTDATMFSIGAGGANPCPTLTPTINPGSNCTIVIMFKPTTEGAKTATLRITSNDPSGSIDVPLTGTGAVAPVISVAPTSKDFGNVNVDSTASHVFTISNTGTADLVVTLIELTGQDAAMFSFEAGGTYPCPSLTPTVLAGQNCSVVVRFRPTSEGAKTASLRITSNDPSGPVDVPLTGVGTWVSVFNDCPETQWAEDYINSIYYAGVTGGCAAGMYCPTNNVTREQMAAFIVRAVEGEPPSDYCDTGISFTDVQTTSPFCKYIKRLVELGVTQGCAAGMYCPTDNVLRQQMAAFIVRAVEGEPPANYCDTGISFADVEPTGVFCKYIKRLVELGVTQGCVAGAYCPVNNVLRDQMAAFLARAFLGLP